MKTKKYNNYLSNLDNDKRKSLVKYLDTSKDMLRQYYAGHSNLTSNRIAKIIEWAKKNTPENIPTFDDLMSYTKKTIKSI